MKFFTDYTNLILLAIACISGLLLVWPVLMRRDGSLSVQQAIQLINRRHAMVIDLRSADEYNDGHIPQAQHLAFEKLQDPSLHSSKNKRTPVLLVCQKGQRAQRAKAVLEQADYAQVFTLQGGLMAWRQEGMPVIKSSKRSHNL